MLASSQRQGGTSLLENKGQFDVPALVADPAGKRIIGVINFRENAQPSGLYALVPKASSPAPRPRLLDCDCKLLGRIDTQNPVHGSTGIHNDEVSFGTSGTLY